MIASLMSQLLARDSTNGMGADHYMSQRVQLIVVVFLALGVYNAAETFIKILRTFRAYQGLYFWALIAASVGIVLHAFGYFFRNFNVIDSLPLQIFLVGPGGMCMITGQSIVLYSRLHLISRNRSKDRWILAIILVNLLVVQVGATTLYAGSQSKSPGKFLSIYKVWERVQVTSFFIQECIISGLYIYRTYNLMRYYKTFRNNPRSLLIHLVLVNILVILLDVTILVFQFAGLYDIQTSWKTLSYSLKLKFEFYVLNRLIEFTKEGLRGGTVGRAGFNGNNLGGGIQLSRREQARASVLGTDGSFRASAYAHANESEGVSQENMPNVIKMTTEITVEEGVDAKSEGSVRQNQVGSE